MRLAFCFMSNDIRSFHRMDNSFCYKSGNVVTSFTKNVLFNPPVSAGTSRWHDWNVRWRAYQSEYTDYFSIRQDSLHMAHEADFIFVGDDDFVFQDGSTEIINECIRYMVINLHCGAVYLASKFGNDHITHNNEIYVINDGHLSTNRGIILRNRKEDLMDNRLHALGANEDFVIGFTCLLQGYYLARRLHMPIEHGKERNNLSEENPNKNYNLQFLKERGIMAKVNEHIGKWEDHNIWPKNIFEYYMEGIHSKGWRPKYKLDGEIYAGNSV